MSPVATELGARFRTVTATTSVIPFDSGNVRSVELPRSFLFRSVFVRLTGTVNSGGAGAYTNNFESPLPLIKRLELVADGRKVLWTAAGRDLFRIAHFMLGKQFELNPPALTANTNNPFSASFRIHNNAVRMQFPADSLFDPREYEKIELRCTWGTVTDIVTGGTAPAVAAATQLSIQVEETTMGVEHIQFNRVIQFDEQAVAATSSNFTFNIPRAGLLAGILLRTDAGTPPAGSDTVINFVTLRSDNSFNHKDRLVWNDLKSANVGDFQLDLGQVTAAPTLGANQQLVTGYGYLDLTEDGLMTSCLNTLGLNVLQLILDVTTAAGAIVRATYIFYEPTRPLVGE